MTLAHMAKWLRDYLSFGGRRPPPQPPTPDYSESEILLAYRMQKNLDFEDPYEDADCRPEPDPAAPPDPKGPSDSKYDSPKHRLIKVEAADMVRAKALLGSPGDGDEVRGRAREAGGAGTGRFRLLHLRRSLDLPLGGGHQLLPPTSLLLSSCICLSFLKEV